MAWTTTNSLDTFLGMVGEYLRSNPVQHNLPLTILESLRQSGPDAFGDSPPVFGWHDRDAGAVDGAFLQTPPFPVLAACLPDGSAESFVDLLTSGAVQPIGANLDVSEEASFTAAWQRATGAGVSVHMRSRLFRLGALVPPDPFPAGASRLADQDDVDLLVEWTVAFGAESGAGGADPRRSVTDRLSYRGFMFWEADGVPVAMAGLSRNVTGVVRVQAVYTPPEHRRRGYGGAVTTAASQAALDAGAADVVLYTDLANPTSNALYQRLGYRPVSDRVQLVLPDVTDRAAVPS
jgi:ribosomal protein S18 acetylase RimI-like enzyme